MIYFVDWCLVLVKFFYSIFLFIIKNFWMERGEAGEEGGEKVDSFVE